MICSNGRNMHCLQVVLSYLLYTILAFFIFGLTGNFAYANSVTASGTQAAVGAGNTVAVKLQVERETVNVRSGPATNDRAIGQLHMGDIVQEKVKSANNWYEIDFQGKTGWVAGWLVQVYRPSSVASQSVPVFSQSVPVASRGLMLGIITTAERYLGRPYHYGASGPSSFDCSGFVHYVFSIAGIDLPRVAAEQARVGERVSSPAPGDLVFFSGGRNGYITHVGIYIGNNSFINADNQGVDIKSLDDPWYHSRYTMASRVI